MRVQDLDRRASCGLGPRPCARRPRTRTLCVEQVIRLQPGDRVMSFFKVNDGRAAKSLKTDVGSVLQVSMEEVHLVFDDNVEQNVSKTWVVQRMRAWDLALEIGDVAYACLGPGT